MIALRVMTEIALAGMLGAGPAAKAATLVLDCTTEAQVRNFGTHNLLEIDLQAKTVHEHVVTSDGAPARTASGASFEDYTEPAEVTDSVVRWRHRIGNDGSGAACYHLEEVGRYTGIWEKDAGCSNASTRIKCHPADLHPGPRLF